MPVAKVLEFRRHVGGVVAQGNSVGQVASQVRIHGSVARHSLWQAG